MWAIHHLSHARATSKRTLGLDARDLCAPTHKAGSWMSKHYSLCSSSPWHAFASAKPVFWHHVACGRLAGKAAVVRRQCCVSRETGLIGRPPQFFLDHTDTRRIIEPSRSALQWHGSSLLVLIIGASFD
ncbi:uncharacterized protein PV09_02179 [Verruconis gallopava]|uniref:Uncharacterized protein n=1 Tax=Verruconis gallopava TaxID=253628 RepID=A0A0D2B7W6_9PEZI|nr:uncharacterized protein PV09_02179 [Verruconis gallopava]KIW07329.1 hypothetical protein PV09_02179 [Verruconis gallopava]